jgi:glucose-6-phosphate 1-dehydrogenase
MRSRAWDLKRFLWDFTNLCWANPYLGRETAQNLLVFRIGNAIFEPVWNGRHIDHVQLIVAESIGVEGRGAFCETAGAFRDVMQNHMFMLLALIAMEPPTSLEGEAIQNEKVKLLQSTGLVFLFICGPASACRAAPLRL